MIAKRLKLLKVYLDRLVTCRLVCLLRAAGVLASWPLLNGRHVDLGTVFSCVYMCVQFVIGAFLQNFRLWTFIPDGIYD